MPINNDFSVKGLLQALQTGLVGGGANSTYTLASNQSIAATTGTTATTGVKRGTYVLDVQFTGTSVQFQSLGADGATWRNVGAAITTPGATSVSVGQGASVRLYNPNGTGLTAVSATLT